MNIITNQINDCEYDYVTSLNGLMPVNLVNLAGMLTSDSREMSTSCGWSRGSVHSLVAWHSSAY